MRDSRPVTEAISRCLDLAARIGFDAPWCLSPGGGWGVAYNEAQLPQPSVDNYIRALSKAVESGCRSRNLPLPRLQLEPGRSLSARAGVALYRVGAIKPMQGQTWVLLDGGLADNPRHALYGVDYSALVVGRPTAAPEAKVCLAGPYCESGDVLSMDLPLSRVEPDDLLAVPGSGAYQLSMASHYNGARLPAVVWLKDGHATLVQERESPADLFRRDHLLDE
jgi:diaminopimelate decarboxylase